MESRSLKGNLLFFQGSATAAKPQVSPETHTLHCEFGPFRLDSRERLLVRADNTVALPPKCFDLLLLLVEHAGRLLDKDTIIRALWPDAFVEEANISNLVGALRKALGDTTRTPQYVQTVSKSGYRFIAAVRAVEDHQSGESAASSTAVAIRIIAFPFRCDTSDQETQFLAYALPEAISSALAELNAFTVRPCLLASRFDPIRWDPKTVATDLEVDVILNGTVARVQGQLHITTQLIDAVKGSIFWSKTWDVTSDDLLQFHNGIVQLLVRTLLQRPPDLVQTPMPKHAPSDSETYQLFLRGNHLIRTRRPENVALARDLYLACTQKDPDFAPAWASLGRCYRFLQKFHVEQGTYAEQSAEAAYQRAFRLCPHLALAHCAYTTFECDKGLAVDAMVRLLREVELNANNPELFAGLVHACRYCGQLEASIAAHERARKLDRNAATSVAHTYFSLGQYENTLYWYGAGVGLYLDALALVCSGRQAEASALVWTRRDRFSLQPALMVPLEAHLNGDSAAGITALRQAMQESQDPEITFYMARHAAAFGDLELANELLSESVTRGYFSAFALMNDPWLASLSETPTYQQTLSLAQTFQNRAQQAFDDANGRGILGLSSK